MHQSVTSRTALRCAVSLLVLAASAPAWAQDQASDIAASSPGQASDAEANSETIVVTGSRIPRSGVNAPTPVSVVSASELLASSPSTAAAALNNLPSLVSTYGPNANGGSASAGRNSLNLRGLGVMRTLTLLDGRRFPATATNNTVDTNLIPQALIQRVEVVTGGASAAYGSDAVAGVVNFILDKEYKGLKADIGYGLTQRGDGAEVHADLTYGTSFADSRAHLILNAEYYDSKIVEGDARAFRRRGANLLTNPNVGTPPTAADPTRLAAPDVRIPATYGGLITSATGGTPANNALLVGTQFLPGGIPAPYDYGTLSTASGQSGGDGINTALIQPILRPLRRAAAFGRLSYAVTDNVTAFLEGSYAATRALAPTQYYHTGNNAMTIQRDNAFLPESIRTQMTTLGITSFRMARYDNEPDSTLRVQNYTSRILGGIEGKLGDLQWQAFYQYGRNKQNVDNFGMYLLDNSRLAVDAVADPVTGNPVCRSTLTNPGNGCVPFNPFGEGSPSAQAIAYTNPLNDSTSIVEDQIAGVNIAGPLFSNWAGEVSFATGIDYRRVQNTVTSNQAAATGQFFTASLAGWQGGYTIWEGFGELNVPLARDLPLLHLLDVNGAVRYADYSTSGGATTWKIGAIWEPVEDLRIRATRSRDIRAPNPEELFRGALSATYPISDPFRGGAQAGGVQFVSRGNPNLHPEKADTTVLGLVYRPNWLRGFDFSVDGYDIKIRDAIANLSPQEYLNRCFAGDAEACTHINRDASGVVTGGFIGAFNFQSLRARGIDFEAGYRTNAWGGSLSVRGLIGYVDELSTTTTVKVDRAGDLNSGAPSTNSVPRWRGLATVNYSTDTISTFLQMRYIGSGKLDVTWDDAATDFNRVAAQVYFDGQIGYRVAPELEFVFNVQNILDKEPPFAPLVSNYNVPTNAALYDQLGRTFRISARFRF